jgi:putative ABC transport system ATP-binding protein
LLAKGYRSWLYTIIREVLMQNEVFIETKDLTKIYPMGDHNLMALDHVTLTFKRGEFAGLVGPSGSGKTTLLNIVGSLDVPTEGSATVLGEKIEILSHKGAAELRNRHIGFIFQTFNLLPVYTVYENVEFPLLLLHMHPSERRRAVTAALEWVGLADRAKSKPNQLSGGQSQRVAIARAIVKKPEIVLADEPTANLDAENSHHILQTMERLNEELKTTFVFSTHDQKVIKYLRRKITLIDGAVAKDEQNERNTEMAELKTKKGRRKQKPDTGSDEGRR